MIRATVIADSVSPAGGRLTTIQTTFPRCILAELNTHRSHSRNSASSRAVPVWKMLEQVRENPFIPLRWQSAKPGMQGGEPLTGEAADRARDAWLQARDHAVGQATALLDLGIHKTMPNRLLEPFMWHTAILSGTTAGWENLWAQRCSPLAEIHMEVTANAIRDAYKASVPVEVAPGGWHLPYITDEDRAALDDQGLRRVSAARCARVSYLTHDGRRDFADDLALFDRLVSADPPHWSPLEHQATPQVGAPGNFDGWLQQRHWLGCAR